ncbi:conserved hypothetical protein [Culex quinquefasciatus]|uniref:F-box domain-containing protein n=1 Tax=Culex quinquefasciatus TaxID=7176 RepID=B0XCY0_CULQU|nr:conserved hypothetical protein [Culex quinquefasciatus]|eukprot:XP_001867502.1 conserved hypothetical protein [Culex quinquefasciatus]
MSNTNLQTSVLDPGRFPSELLEHIFRHLALRDLKSALLVCRHWRDRIGASSTLMGRVVLRFPKDRPLDRRHPGVWHVMARRARLERCSVLSVEPWWAAFGSKLVRIDLSMVTVDLPVLLAMLRQTTNLRELDVGYSTVVKGEDFDGDLRLNSLEVLLFHRASPGLVKALKNGCPRLKRLSVTHHTAPGEPYLLELVQTVQGTLKVLKLRLTDTVLEAVSEMDQLKLTNAWVQHCNDVLLTVQFCRLQPTLTTLSVFGRDITGSILAEIGELLTNLKHLSVCFAGIDHETLSMDFLRTMPKLESLHLLGDPHTRRFKHLQPIDPSRRANLKSLQLKYLSVHPDETWQFLARSHRIQTLSLAFCHLQNWPQFAQALGRLPSLKQLTLHYNTVLAWPQTPARFTNATTKALTLSFPIPIPKNHLDSLLYSFPNLSELNLADTRTFDDATIQHLSHRFAKLRKLTIKSCFITDDTVRHFCQHPGQLERLELRTNSRVSSVGRLEEKIDTVVFVPAETGNRFRVFESRLVWICWVVVFAFAFAFDYYYFSENYHQ